ncbi:Tetrahydroberberine oxidase [Handroanthus impetiginosus]|uniref:Tetrahydroberberine oxidase n=1 Tax=Handroanthus impetiginosus TaxID=429701 RepID=A0A2G9GA18_9LAMI|nr:Tetrahydroberberine oxidase [Handroanthus impetiginosus]
MKTLSNFAIIIFSFFSAFLLSVSWASSNYSSHQDFIQCLESHSDPSSPISAVLYSPYNSSYSSVLQDYIRNLRFNESTTPKPRLILTALHVSHIQAAIICAKAHRMQMKIRSGGHDYEGISYRSNNPNFFILDMFNFRSINVSIEDETASVEVGATLGEVYYRIAEKSSTHAFPAGVCPTVGVGGHIGGGGYGNLMRKYGLTVDNIIDAQIIDVNGRLLNRKSMGEDLFWAITGGGGSSFGVVLSYKIKLVRVPKVVTVFRVSRTYNENFTDLVYRYQEVADKLPKELFIRLTLNGVNGTNRGTFRALFLGNSQELISVMNKHFSELALNQTDCIEMSWIESVLFWTDLPTTPVNALLDRVPQSFSYLKRKSDYVKKPIPKQGLEFIFKKMVELQTPVLAFNPYGGRMAEISPSEKPFPHRAGNIFKLQYATNWDEDGEEAASRYLGVTRKLYDYMTPYVSTAPREAFLNYRDLDIGINHNGRNSYVEGAVYGVKYFKDNFNRLVKIKTKVDPDNFFRNEQSIPILPWRK